MLAGYIDGIMLIGPSKQEVATTLHLLVRHLFLCHKVGSKSDKNLGVFYLGEISRGLVGQGMSRCSFWGDNQLLRLAPPMTKNEAQCLVALHGFWKERILH